MIKFRSDHTTFKTSVFWFKNGAFFILQWKLLFLDSQRGKIKFRIIYTNCCMINKHMFYKMYYMNKQYSIIRPLFCYLIQYLRRQNYVVLSIYFLPHTSPMTLFDRIYEYVFFKFFKVASSFPYSDEPMKMTNRENEKAKLYSTRQTGGVKSIGYKAGLEPAAFLTIQTLCLRAHRLSHELALLNT